MNTLSDDKSKSDYDRFVTDYALTFVMEAAFRVWLMAHGNDINKLTYRELQRLYYTFKTS